MQAPLSKSESSQKVIISLLPKQHQSSPSKEKKRESRLSRDATSVLKKWLYSNLENPYLKLNDKVDLCRETGLTSKQVQNWFINVRKVSYISYLIA